MQLTSELVEEMKRVATSRPHKPLETPTPPSACRRMVQYGEETYSIGFTLAVSGKIRMWHLDVYRREGPISKEVGRALAVAFFGGTGYEEVELAETMVELMKPSDREEYRTGCHRQYVQPIEE